ncbi:MAG: prepilin-type N-terminal cleavage/methylation domain-containing protein [Terrimicrobiaceae bacterium]|nr:prepilin-type N-terminal cleavage/methylation domain-containing protein [Terrimicrobiaceae bacterium]
MTPAFRVRHPRPPGFTVIELITVVAILAVLATLLLTAAGRAMEAARRTQAAHDVREIVEAVDAYYTEYGHYPVRPDQEGSEVTFRTDNSDLFYALRAVPKGANSGDALNPRRVVFLEAPEAKGSLPRAGIARGIWYDPWGPQPGKPESGIYHVRIDAGYRGTVSDPYPGGDFDEGGGSAPMIHTGVIAWSLAKGGLQTYQLLDQIVSWK